MIILSILLIFFIKNFLYYKDNFSKNRLFYLLKRYKKFPLYSLPASLMNSAGSNVHFMLIESFFGATATGVFSMVQRLVYAPIALISGTINNVVYQKFTYDVVNNNPVYDNMKKVAVVMSIVGLVIVLVIFIASEYNILTLFLGKDWSKANDLLIYFLPIILIFMVSSSIARFAIFERQEISLYFQTFLFIVVFFSIIIGNYLTNNFEYTILIYALALSLVFLLQLNISLYLAKKHDKGIK